MDSRKKCTGCKKTFRRGRWDTPSRWASRKVCSLKCRTVWNKGLTKSTDNRIAELASKTRATQFSSANNSGSKNTNWKGENASYYAKHIWVANNFGKPALCEDCHISGNERKYHWANISKLYRRERTDWKRLCVPCHKRFDIARSDYSKVGSRNQTGVRGVQYANHAKKWRATLTINKKTKHLGYFYSKEDAIAARINAEKEMS